MRAIVGTAGHIDHGKSALVRALTGIDPDRLPEERERGISIELGFAHLETQSGERIGFVDVPGHERFIRHMVAGAQGFDYVLVVVAADDGVMPQTEEHFEICHLLGLAHGAFVITKCDLASVEQLADVSAEIALLAEGTVFASAPTFHTSVVTGEGIAGLRDHLTRALASVERRVAAGVPFRLPVDRAFVLKGHGLVVTGTATSGCVETGDELVVAPSATRARVREVQVHGSRVASASAGQRVALNLAGVDAGDVDRGSWLVSGEGPAPTRRFEARVEVRPSALEPLRSHRRVRLHLGTNEAIARIVWLGGTTAVAPKERGLCQVVLRETPVVALPGDRFVLRDETGRRTLGGGRVLLAHAPKRRAHDHESVSRLPALESAELNDRVAAYLDLCGGLVATVADIARELGVCVADVERTVATDDAVIAVQLGENDRSLAARSRFEGFADRLAARVHRHHVDVPSAPGLETETLRRGLDPILDLRMFRAIVEGLCSSGRLERRGAAVAVPGHAVRMAAKDEDLSETILAELRSAGAMPPAVAELQQRYGTSSETIHVVLAVLVERGKAVRVASDLYFATESVDRIADELSAYLQREGRIAPSAFRDLITASRKYVIPLLDYFDRCGLTVRTGDHRVLRQ